MKIEEIKIGTICAFASMIFSLVLAYQLIWKPNHQNMLDRLDRIEKKIDKKKEEKKEDLCKRIYK